MSPAADPQTDEQLLADARARAAGLAERLGADAAEMPDGGPLRRAAAAAEALADRMADAVAPPPSGLTIQTAP